MDCVTDARGTARDTMHPADHAQRKGTCLMTGGTACETWTASAIAKSSGIQPTQAEGLCDRCTRDGKGDDAHHKVWDTRARTGVAVWQCIRQKCVSS